MKYTKDDSRIVIGMHRLVNEMDSATRTICKKYGITLGQIAVLEALNSKGELTVGQIKELVLSSDGTIPVVIGNLENRGYVMKHQDDADKRKFFVNLTAEGERMIQTLYPENEKALAEITGRLSKEDKAMLVDLIRKMR